MKAFLLAAPIFAVLGLAKADPPPNIIFIFTDDQGWGDIGTPMDPAVPEATCSSFHTPNLDRLASEGMRFSSGYASAPLCTPTRRSIQFGMTPARQRGTEFLSEFRPKGYLSIAQALKQANPHYRCAHFGKWGEAISGGWSDRNLDAVPDALGYDESDGGDTGNVTGTFYDSSRDKANSHRNHICEPDADPKRTFSVTERSVAFMERQVREKRPFYLQVSYYAIHTALQARPETLAKYAGKVEPTRQVADGVAPMLEDLDTGIGQILDAVDRLGIRDNTYVFFSSDNGGAPSRMPPERESLPSRNHPLRMHKQYLYEGGIRVPFIVRGPGIKAGAISREPVALYDLLPTFYDLAGGGSPLASHVDGGSLRAPLENEGAGTVERPLPGLVFHRPLRKDQPHSALRAGDFKLVLTWSGPWQVKHRELFNLVEDIGEQKNLADAMPEKTEEMTATLIDYLKAVNAETARPAAPLSP